MIPPVPYVGDIVPHFDSYYGHADAFALGSGVGTVTGVVASFAVGNIASGASGLVACGSLAQRAAQLYTTASTVLGVAGAAVNIAQTRTVGVGDALALAPAIGFGLGKLSAATYCFFAGTPVATEFGQKPIESVRAGERVWSCDLTSGVWRLCRVSETYANDHVGDLIAVSVAASRIESTYHHPYWVVEGRDLEERPTPDHVASAFVPNATVPGRWVDAGDLRIGDVLLLMDGRRAPIEEILVRQVQDLVYNFAVDGLHNYAVGLDRVLVHNNCAASASGPFSHGQQFRTSFQTSQGEVGFIADTVVEGNLLHLKDILVSPIGGNPLSIGASEVLKAQQQLMNLARSAGFEQLRITGLRFTGANPGHFVDILINLLP